MFRVDEADHPKRYNKNWAWASTDLWYQRWKQAIALQIQVDFTPPEFIEIISWNDFGEVCVLSQTEDRQHEWLTRNKYSPTTSALNAALPRSLQDVMRLTM